MGALRSTSSGQGGFSVGQSTPKDSTLGLPATADFKGTAIDPYAKASPHARCERELKEQTRDSQTRLT